jgi:hypothetical protein
LHQECAGSEYEVYLPCATQWVNPETDDDHRLFLVAGEWN